MKIKYLDKPFIKRLFYKAMPFVIASILSGLITLVDNWMIGMMQSTGSGELAAASLSNKYINIVNIFISAMIAMFSFFIFQYKGKGNLKMVQQLFKIMVQFALVISIVAILVAYFATDEIIHLFQGSNYWSDVSSGTGLAQSYLRVQIWKIIPVSIFTIFIIGVNAFDKQRILVFISIISISINALLNYLFYKVASEGIIGIAYSTIFADSTSLLIIIWWIWRNKLGHAILFNPLTIFLINLKLLVQGAKRFMMGFQVLLWSSIGIAITIIYSRWYGDIANNALGIAAPIVAMFYTALNAIAATKGFFVGTLIGKGDVEEAFETDKKINMYTGIVATCEGTLLMSLAYFLPMAFTGSTSSDQWNATLILIFTGATYPIAAMSKTLLGSFKVAGMGKTIVLSNGIFALMFEFLVPLILFIFHQYGYVQMDFWAIYLLARCIKLLKLPPTLYFWKKKKWLESAI